MGSSVELICFLFQLAYGISSGVITNMWLKSYCLLLPNITESNCSGLIPTEIENIVQPQVATISFVKTVIDTLLPGFAVLFVGPWSDVHGRRPVLLFCMLGFTISYFMWVAFSFQIDNIRPEYFLLASLPIGLSGGYSTYFLSLICAISDTTAVHSRAFKMALFEAACMLGSFVSQLLTAKVSAGPHGFFTTFSISGAICLTLLIYIYFFFNETVIPTQEIPQKSSLIDVFKTTFKSRPNCGRSLLFLIVLANTAFICTVFGESSIFYLNTQKRFQWQLKEYSQLASFGVVTSGAVLYFGTWFLSYILKLSDMLGLLIVSLPRIASSLIYAFCTNWRLLYLGMAIGSIGTLITPLYRSQVSKLVPLHELGKVMGFIMFLESLVPVTGTGLYTVVYNNTLEVMPGAVFLVSAGLSATCSICVGLALFKIHFLNPSQESIYQGAGMQKPNQCDSN